MSVDNSDDSTNEICTRENKTSEIDTIYGKKLIVTCVERRYKIVDSRSSFIIVARKEFDEDTTEKMLYEDMEVKTFLANYEIVDITSPSSRGENIKIQKKKMPEMGKKEESESTKKRRDIIMTSLKRRELFDSLDLPEEFLVSDYTEAVEKHGIKVPNPRVSRDDLKWFVKKGKVEMIGKIDHGASVYKLIKNTETDLEKESRPDENQSDDLLNKGLLPGKDSIDRYI